MKEKSNIENLIKYIQENNLGIYILDEDLSKYTSFKIGGKCKIMFFPKDIDSVKKVYRYILNNNLSYFIIGNGTNLLINERYFNQVFINLKNIKTFHKLNSNHFFIGAGCTGSKIALELSKKGYSGLEFLGVIPGTIGGAIYMNAGAYSFDVSKVTDYVLILNEKAELKLINKNNCMFGYRSSIFQKQKSIILGIIVNVRKTKYKDAPYSKIKYYASNKKNTQPLDKKNAGSTFKNSDSVNAWQVIDKLGYRGKSLGGAKVSNKHANFIVNNDQATFNDIYTLTKQIQKDAKEILNIDLEYEWEILK